jgi:hypothetical protein
MPGPISPPPVSGGGIAICPPMSATASSACASAAQPLQAGMALVSGYVGEDPERRIEAAAPAPYPLAGRRRRDGVWLSDQHIRSSDLNSLRLRFGRTDQPVRVYRADRRVELHGADLRQPEDPTLVCQEIALRSTAPAICRSAPVATTGVLGRALRFLRDTPGEDATQRRRGAALGGGGGAERVGLAYVTEMSGGAAADVRGRGQRWTQQA